MTVTKNQFYLGLIVSGIRTEAFDQRDVGHSVVATGRGGLRLSSSISTGV